MLSLPWRGTTTWLPRRSRRRRLVLAELYRQKVAALEEALADPEEGAQAMEMIRLLVDALVLTPEAGKLRVDLTGELTAILSIAQKGQRPRPEDEAHALQVKLVAGARNCLYLLLFAGRLNNSYVRQRQWS